MALFNKGDIVRLGVNNGTKAFSALSPNSQYQVEAVGSSCSACANGRAGKSTTVKVMGTYFCEEAFVIASAPKSAANQAMQGGKGIIAERRDPARDLYSASSDEYDTLPDYTHEEAKTLLTYEQLEELEAKKNPNHPRNFMRKEK